MVNATFAVDLVARDACIALRLKRIKRIKRVQRVQRIHREWLLIVVVIEYQITHFTEL